MAKYIEVDVFEGGVGVTGASFLFNTASRSNIRSVVAIEKYGEPATVNSHPLMNAQTRHRGGHETNYSLEHALPVRDQSDLIGGYCRLKNDPELFQVRHHMTLAVTEEEKRKLEERHATFKPHYPDMELIYRDEIGELEPNIVKGRNLHAPLCALLTRQADIVNYQCLAKHLLHDAQELNPDLRVHFNTSITNIRKDAEGYVVETNRDMTFHARVLVFATGAYSLHFAQMLGYGNRYGILSVSGSFFDLGHQVDSKVYRCQKEGRPFAEIHIDPDILDMMMTRGGPTTLPVPLMENHHWETCPDYVVQCLGSGYWFDKEGLRRDLYKYLPASMRPNVCTA